MRLFSIRYKLGLVFFTGTFVFVLGLVGFQQFYSYIEFKRYIEHNAVMTVRAAILLTERWSVERTQAMQLLAYGAARLAARGGDISTEFRELALDAGLPSARIGFEDGRLLTPEGTREDASFRGEDWYKTANERRSAVSLPPRRDPVTGKYKITFAAPIYDERGWMLRGAVSADVFIEELKPVVGTVFMAEVEDLVPFSMGKDRVGLFVKSQAMPAHDVKAAIDSLASAASSAEGTMVQAGESRYSVVLENLDPVGITVAYPVPLTQLVRPLLVQTLAVFLMTAIGLWIIAKLVWSVLRGFLARIEDLNATTKKVAAGNFEIRLESRSRDEVGELAGSFNHMVGSLKQYMSELEKTVREKEQIAKELEIASELQRGALPKELPHLRGLEISAKSLPARSVGGDYYDFLYPGAEKVGLIIADAAGKGFPGSYYMSNSRTIFHIVSQQSQSPAELMKRMNEQVVRENPELSGMFITYVYAVYDGSAGTLTYANAGHFPPLFYRAAQRDFLPLESSGFPIGIMAGQEYGEEVLPFGAGDILVLYTDGVIEAMNARDEMYGLERLKDAVRKYAGEKAVAILQRIAQEVQDFSRGVEQHDDITIVVAKIVGFPKA